MRTIEELLLKTRQFRREESGSLVVFSIFLFVLILMIAGMAVDMMRHEQRRVALQNTIDSAVIAASSINQDLNAELVVRDYVSKAGFDPNDVTISANQSDLNGQVTGRSVMASADFSVGTLFMGFMDIDELHGVTASRAEEGTQFFEVSLVLDISGSMYGTKLDRLKVAAKNFVTTLMDNNGVDNVIISIVPYNQHVLMSPELQSRIDNANQVVTIGAPILMASASGPNSADLVAASAQRGAGTNSGALTQYNTVNMASHCVAFEDDDFHTRRLVASNNSHRGQVNFTAVWADRIRNAYEQPTNTNSYCADGRQTSILAFENDETTLHNHIDAFRAGGNTSVDLGMKWGTALLDPYFQGVVNDMVDDGVLASSATDHPVDFGRDDARKIVVLMTDGINTLKEDLKEPFKAGPSRIWFSETQADGYEFDGYLVEMPDNSASQRWYVPGNPYDSTDDTFLAEDALPDDAAQWDHHAVYSRFELFDVASYFFARDDAAYRDYRNAENTSGSYGEADTRLTNICNAAKTRNEIAVYTVAFEAPTAAERLLAGCATSAGHHFDVDGTGISDAFNSIASHISLLRLTE